jgi:hypothetical protein
MPEVLFMKLLAGMADSRQANSNYQIAVMYELIVLSVCVVW